MIFGDWSHEETERQQPCARSKAWNLAKNKNKLRLHSTRPRKNGYSRLRQSLERNLYGHPVAGLLWERQFEKVLLKYGWGKVPNWECLFVNREEVLFLSVYVDDIKMASKTENMKPTWKI